MLVEGSYSLQMTERPSAILGGFTVECASLATLKSMNPVVGPIKFLPQPVQAKKKRTFTAKLFVVQSRGLCCLNFTCANCAPVQVWACGRGCFLKHKIEMLPISQTAWCFCRPLSASSKLNLALPATGYEGYASTECIPMSNRNTTSVAFIIDFSFFNLFFPCDGFTTLQFFIYCGYLHHSTHFEGVLFIHFVKGIHWNRAFLRVSFNIPSLSEMPNKWSYPHTQSTPQKDTADSNASCSVT